MKTKKQRRTEMQVHRARRAGKVLLTGISVLCPGGGGAGTAPCDPALLAPASSCMDPEFVRRGYYMDQPFQCVDCQRQEIWTAARQKWWYEVAKGKPETGANRCNACRRIERERKAEARRVHLEGLARKLGAVGW